MKINSALRTVLTFSFLFFSCNERNETDLTNSIRDLKWGASVEEVSARYIPGEFNSNKDIWTHASTILRHSAKMSFLFQDHKMLQITTVAHLDSEAVCETEIDKASKLLSDELGNQNILSTDGCVSWTKPKMNVDFCCGKDAKGAVLVLTYARKDISFDRSKH